MSMGLEIVMDILKDINLNNVSQSKIKQWFSYVDKRFIFLEGRTEEANLILDKINTLHNNIKFIIEYEKDNNINFLYLTNTEIENRLIFNIYRKPTRNNYLILASSYHPFQYKMTAFQFFVHRMNFIPLSEDKIKKDMKLLEIFVHSE